MKLRFIVLALALALLTGGLIYSFQQQSQQQQQNDVFSVPYLGGPFFLRVHVYGVEDRDEVSVIAVEESSGHASHVLGSGSGSYRVALQTPSGVWVVQASANGYTVEPESYRVVLKDGKVVEPNQELKFMFQK